MRTYIKYSLIVIYSIVFVYIVFSQFVENWIVLLVIILSLSSILTYLSKKIIHQFSASKLFLLLSFFLLITTPIIGEKETKSLENRNLKEFPTMRLENIWAFFFEYQEYFNDRFSFRNQSVELIGKIKLHAFNRSSVPHLALVGKDNWLFSAQKEYIDETSKPFTEQELQQIKRNLIIITKWFDEKNIKFYFFMAPIKARIYPEMMPDVLRYKNNFSRIDQLFNYIQGDTNIRAINAKKELIEGKKIRPTYFNSDTHWNQFGAFIGYKKITERIQQDFSTVNFLKENDFKLDSSISSNGDIQMILGFNGEIDFMNYYYTPITVPMPESVDSMQVKNPSWMYSINKMSKKGNGLRLFMIRDSFTQYLKLFLSPNFDYSFYAWTPKIPVDVAIESKPDIVIYEMLEMFSNYLLVLPPEIEADSTFIKKYFP